jgi:hypothetical protein
MIRRAAPQGNERPKRAIPRRSARRTTPTGDYAEADVIQLLRTALMLQGVFCDLLEGMPDNAFPAMTLS